MANYGLQVLDSAGGVIFDSRDIGWLLIDSFAVGALDSGSKSYPWIPGTQSLHGLSVNELTSMGGGHNVTTSGNVVNWSPVTGSPMAINRNSPSIIYVFLK